ncbi:sensor histidine kinase [Naasia lichenicola]|uniref:Signal transduction histidine kinase subgroup 3 dimerisation and phosphoacceptor domain-containing protein n=1 Tax=Naasia lichenicola TaxID=2565933 RepID=A0A4V3WSN4_9MICO|nr:histidine kinase [Naasia lichenicola]THG28537.1 hypothetical protein E6C64_17130 [Naasia lichenicola]
MTAKRIGLVLAALLALAAIPPALEIAPDPETDSVALPLIALAITVAVALATLVLLIPAWRGGRRSSVAIAVLALLGAIPSLPVYFLPADVVPAGGVVAAAIGTLLCLTAFALVLIDVSTFVLYLVTSLAVVAMYAIVVAVASEFLPAAADRTVHTVAAISFALLFGPLLSLLRRAVGRSIYGDRADPARTALKIGWGATERQDGTSAALSATARALRLPRLELQRSGSTVADSAASPTVTPSRRVVEMPVDVESDLIVRVTLRPGERRLHSRDRDALQLVALSLSHLVRETQLLEDLRLARAGIVEARSREQVRLHRDLHDDLGPLLTGAVMRADAARNQMSADDQARANLDLARADLRSAIAHLRRVVEGLWPLDLEQRGLWSAVEHRADRAGASLMLPAARPELSAAIGLAAFRIVGEALTNAEKHAQGQPVSVTLALTAGSLEIEIANEATMSRPVGNGMGVPSLRHRAEELGGHADIGPVPGGWRVFARLPNATAVDLEEVEAPA